MRNTRLDEAQAGIKISGRNINNLRYTFSFRIIPSKEIPGLISFGMDWLDLLAVHGTFKSVLQHHSSKDSFL